jgi:hypothetical protein
VLQQTHLDELAAHVGANEVFSVEIALKRRLEVLRAARSSGGVFESPKRQQLRLVWLHSKDALLALQ